MKLKVVATVNTAALNRQAAFDRQAFIFDWVKKKWAEFKDWFENKIDEFSDRSLSWALGLSKKEAFKNSVRANYGTAINSDIKDLVKKLNTSVESRSLSPKEVDDIINEFEVGSLIKKLATEFPVEKTTASAKIEKEVSDYLDDEKLKQETKSYIKVLNEIADTSKEKAESFKKEVLKQQSKNEHGGVFNLVLSYVYIILACVMVLTGLSDLPMMIQTKEIALYSGYLSAVSSALFFYSAKDTFMRLMYKRILNKEKKDISERLDNRAKDLKPRLEWGEPGK